MQGIAFRCLPITFKLQRGERFLHHIVHFGRSGFSLKAQRQPQNQAPEKMEDTTPENFEVQPFSEWNGPLDMDISKQSVGYDLRPKDITVTLPLRAVVHVAYSPAPGSVNAEEHMIVSGERSAVAKFLERAGYAVENFEVQPFSEWNGPLDMDISKQSVGYDLRSKDITVTLPLRAVVHVAYSPAPGSVNAEEHMIVSGERSAVAKFLERAGYAVEPPPSHC